MAKEAPQEQSSACLNLWDKWADGAIARISDRYGAVVAKAYKERLKKICIDQVIVSLRALEAKRL